VAAIISGALLLVHPVRTINPAQPVYMESAAIKPIAKPVSIANTITPAAPIVTPIIAPQIIYKVLPQYPKNALNAGLEGSVLLSAYIDLSGNVSQVLVKTSSGVADFDQSAINAISQWKYNTAVQCCIDIPVRFVLARGE
jgi:protein TonB